MIILLQICELVTLVKLSCVSCKLKNGNLLGGGKLSCLQGCEPPRRPAGARGRARAADCWQGSTLLRHGAARPRRNSLAFSNSPCFLSPRGCNVLVKNGIFRWLTPLSDGFNRLVVITPCFYMGVSESKSTWIHLCVQIES